ncbi:MAG: hypothetical protein JNM56_27340 [Planctomycetia bacterium]|nr:hypothetical protein [Planctomycetia bacterium]
MRRLVLGSVLTLLALTAAQAQETAATLLDKAMQAAGGEAKLAKLQGLMLKGKGTFHEPGGQNIPFTAVWHYQGRDKYRQYMEMEVMKKKTMELRVVNGDKGWTKDGPLEAEIMDKDELNEEKENVYFNWVTTLAPLKGKDFKLTKADEIKVDGKAAIGLLIASKGHRDVKLYFDKETHALVKTERKVRDLSTRKDILEEMYFSNVKDVDGIKLPLKYAVKWDGQPLADAEMTEAKATEKLDEKLFAKP